MSELIRENDLSGSFGHAVAVAVAVAVAWVYGIGNFAYRLALVPTCRHIYSLGELSANSNNTSSYLHLLPSTQYSTPPS